MVNRGLTTTTNFSTAERVQDARQAKESKRKLRIGGSYRKARKLRTVSTVTDQGGIADIEPPDHPGEGQPTYTVLYNDTDHEIVDYTDLHSGKYSIGRHFKPAKLRKPRGVEIGTKKITTRAAHRPPKSTSASPLTRQIRGTGRGSSSQPRP